MENQTQYSFAASAFDVLATYKKLSEREEIDSDRIGAQGHSRGGSAILTAVTRKFADPIIGNKTVLKLHMRSTRGLGINSYHLK